MHVDDIVYLEEETAHRWAKKLNMRNALDVHETSGDCNIVEVSVPKRFVGLTLEDTRIRSEYNLLVLTTLKLRPVKNAIGIKVDQKVTQDLASAQTVLEEGDVLVLYGKTYDIERFLNV